MAKAVARRKRFHVGALLMLLLACCPAFAQDWIYRVRPGDTLWDLAGEYLKPSVGWQQLQQHNRIDNPYQLPPGSQLRIPLAWLHRQPVKASVVAVQGHATIRTSRDGGARPVLEGMQLSMGTWLQTAAEGSLSLQFADGSRVRLREDSELVLDRMSRYGRSGMVDTQLRLQRGRITNEVRPLRGPGAKFIVDTPTASSAVRGTQFRISVKADRTQAEVLEGRVAVNAGARTTLIKRGFGTIATVGAGGALTQVALLPAPDLSGIPAASPSMRPQFSWPAVAGASRYRVQLSRHPDFATVEADIVTDAPSATAPVLESGAHFIQVNAIDADGLEGLEARAGFSVDGQPEPPYVISPAAGSLVRELRPTLRWTQSLNARHYRYEIADNPEFRDPIASGSDLTGDAATVAQPLPPGAYYWRVGSIDAQGKKGPFGDAIAFTLRPLEPIHDIQPDSGKERTQGVTFRWRAGQPGQRYRFQMSRSPDFSRLRVDETVDQAEITLPKLAGGTWYLRAQAVDINGEVSAFAEPQKVKLPCRLCRIGAGAGAVILLLSL